MSDYFLSVSTFSTWTSNLIERSPDVAAYLGEVIIKQLSNSTKSLNSLLRSSGTNREIIAECRLVLSVLRQCVTALLNDRNN